MHLPGSSSNKIELSFVTKDSHIQSTCATDLSKYFRFAVPPGSCLKSAFAWSRIDLRNFPLANQYVFLMFLVSPGFPVLAALVFRSCCFSPVLSLLRSLSGPAVPLFSGLAAFFRPSLSGAFCLSWSALSFFFSLYRVAASLNAEPPACRFVILHLLLHSLYWFLPKLVHEQCK